MRPPAPYSNSSLPSSSRRQSHAPSIMTPLHEPNPLPNLHSTPETRPKPHTFQKRHAVPNTPSESSSSNLSTDSPPLPNTYRPHDRQAAPAPSRQSTSNPPVVPRNAPKQEVQTPQIQDKSTTFQIGMAMLEDEPSETDPRAYFDRNSDEVVEFDPYNSTHLEKDDPRTPSPLVYPQPENSGKLTRLADSHMTQATSATPVRKLEVRNASPLGSPPPYTSPIEERNFQQYLRPEHAQTQTLRLQDKSQPSSRGSSPGRGSPRTSEENSSSELRRGRSAMDAATSHPPSQRPSVTREQPNPVQMATSPPTPMSPPQRTPGRDLLSTSLQHESDRDGRSTHHSVSTHSSNQSWSSRPPSSRHVPKRLVMPAPLNARLAQTPNQVGGYLPPSAYLPPKQATQQIQFPPPRQMYGSPRAMMPPVAPRSAMPPPRAMPPVQAVVKAQDIQITAKGGKLRKRVSMISNPSNAPSAPIVTTVSFAPPIIGFDRSYNNQKMLGRSKTEMVPKRLSKRRTNL